MSKPMFNLFGTAVASLLITGAVLPANAAPGGAAKEAGKPILPENIVEVAFIGVISVTALSVLVGTGKSIKYNYAGAESEEGDDSSVEHEESHAEADLSDAHHELPNPNSLNETSDKHADVVAASPKKSKPAQKVDYRKEYLKLQEEVRQSPDFANNPSWEVDPWEVDVEIALMVLASAKGNKEEVEKILLQSDQVLELQSSLPSEEYLEKASEYIDKAYSWAQDLYQWRQDKNNSGNTGKSKPVQKNSFAITN